MDYTQQLFNNVAIASKAEYAELCAQAEIPARTVAQISEHRYGLEYARFDATQWAAMTREDHCRQVIDEAYLAYLLTAAQDRKRARRTPELVACDCGHSIPRAEMMNASMGTSCPSCYDRMSD